MLQVKSFKLADGEAISSFLAKYRLAPGASILVSNGELAIPYEDGTPDPLTHRKLAIGEQKNVITRELDIIKHSQKVVRVMIADAKAKFEVAKAKADANKSNKKLEQDCSMAENALNQADNQRLMNDAEITRLQLNLDMFDEQLAELSA